MLQEVHFIGMLCDRSNVLDPPVVLECRYLALRNASNGVLLLKRDLVRSGLEVSL